MVPYKLVKGHQASWYRYNYIVHGIWQRDTNYSTGKGTTLSKLVRDGQVDTDTESTGNAICRESLSKLTHLPVQQVQGNELAGVLEPSCGHHP